MSARMQVSNSWSSWLSATLVVVCLLFGAAGCAPEATQQVGQATPSPLQSTPIPLPIPTAIPSPTAASAAVFSYVFGESCQPNPDGTASRCLVLANGELKEVDLRAHITQFYDYAPATHRILFGSLQPGQPVGLGFYGANDLQVLDVASGKVETLVKEQLVVRALWAPNGRDLVYHRAATATYELLWRSASGDERLLAANLPPVFGFAPSGNEVVFTRESNPPLNSVPGIYSVSVDNGNERQLSNVDRAGEGVWGDRPLWSGDGQYFFLAVKGELYLFAADGSLSSPVYYDPSLASQPWFRLPQDVPPDKFNPPPSGPILWHPDGHHFIGSAYLSEGGESKEVMLYDLHLASRRIVSGTVLAEEGTLITWDKVGQSVWIQASSGGRPEVKSVPLPP